MSLAERRWLRLFTLCVLYVAQGIPWGFTALTLPAYLAKRGLDATAIGTAMAATVLPYSFKWIWGPIMDAFTIRRFGRRRPWIVFAQGMMALTIGAMLAIPDITRDLNLLMQMVFIHTIFNSMQDVAVDALAVDLLDENERGRANGLMYGSKYGGGVIGGAGMSAVIAWSGLRTALVMQTIILVAIMMVPLLVRERAGEPAKGTPIGVVLRSLLRAFTLRSTILTGLLMLGQTIAIGMMSAISAVLFTQHLGWSDTKYAAVAGGPALFLGLGGSVLGGFLADKVGHRRLAALAMVTLAVLWTGFAFAQPLWKSDVFIYSILLVEPTCVGLMTVSLFALCMDVSWPRIAATQFTAYMSLANFSTTLGYRLAGHAAGWWTFQGIYLAAAVIHLAVAALLPFIDPHQTRRTLGAELE